jgi:hypothetical protein
LLGLWPHAASAWASEDLVEFEINGQQLAIPGGYIANVARKDDGSTRHIRMSVLWPSLEPLTESNRHLWRPDLPGRQVISVILSDDVDDGYAMLQSAIRLSFLDPMFSPGPFGLQKYEKDHPRIRRTARRYVADSSFATPAQTPLTFGCDDLFSWDAHETLDLEPICTTDYGLGVDVGLYYRFYRQNLQHWREIDTSIRTLAMSFLQSPEN